MGALYFFFLLLVGIGWKVCGDFKNKLDLLLIGDIPCLKNLIIFITVSASFGSLGDKEKLKLNGRRVGAWNSKSKFKFIAPVVLIKF